MFVKNTDNDFHLDDLDLLLNGSFNICLCLSHGFLQQARKTGEHSQEVPLCACHKIRIISQLDGNNSEIKNSHKGLLLVANSYLRLRWLMGLLNLHHSGSCNCWFQYSRNTRAVSHIPTIGGHALFKTFVLDLHIPVETFIRTTNCLIVK